MLVSNGVKDLSVGLTVLSRSMKREGALLGTRLGGLVFTMFIAMTSLCSRGIRVVLEFWIILMVSDRSPLGL